MGTEDEDIIPAGAVQVPGVADTTETPVNEGAEPNAEANPNETDVTEPNGDDGEYEIDGVKYTAKELDDVLRKGKTLHEYQKAHPGFDPWLLERDYRIKTGELAELKRAGDRSKTAPEPQVDLSEFDPEEVQKFEKIAKAKGLVSRAEVEEEQRNRDRERYNSEKTRQVNEFLKKNPQYLPANDPGDLNWGKLQKEFGLYKMPSDPSEIGRLLDRAHQAISGGSSVALKDVKTIFAAKKVNKVAATSGGGAGNGGTAAPKSAAKGDKSHLAQFLKGFSADEIKSIIK